MGNDIVVRDSKDPNSALLVFSRPEWETFMTGAKVGEFDFGV
jgi:hypothetical protein